MQYYDENERNGKRAGAVAAAAYLVVIAIVLLTVKIEMHTEQPGEGILIDFGDVEAAGGSMSAAQLEPSDNRRPGDTPPPRNTEQLMTQDVEEAPAIQPEQPKPAERPSQSEQQQAQQATPPPAERPREVDQRALFPGNASSNNSQSQGTSEGAGRQGAQEGTPGGNPDGSGTGAQGAGFSLAGRSILGALPQPRYGPDKSGRVVVDITVDAAGRVIRSVYRAQGSTTNDSELVKAALDAAAKAQFNKVEGDGLQTGTITYNFILK